MARWQVRAQRTLSGLWLHTDVPIDLEMTWSLSDYGHASGFIPAAVDVDRGEDDESLWLERGTTLIAENVDDPNADLWVGLCSYQMPALTGRKLEFVSMAGAFDRIAFEGELRQWQPDPYDIVRHLIADAQGQPNAGSIGFTVTEVGRAPTYAGDERPPERPVKPKRRRGESFEAYDDRKLFWEERVDDWQRDFADREPYHLAYWDGAYVGEEIRELADEIGFDWFERHTWANRANLTRRSELVLTTRRGLRDHDQALIEGVNVMEVLAPQTNLDGYANNVIALGSGEGRQMRTARSSLRDNRIRTTLFVDAKNTANQRRLQAIAARTRRRAVATVTLDSAQARNLGPLTLGREIEVRSRKFNGWCRLTGVTRSTKSETVGLTFQKAERKTRT